MKKKFVLIVSAMVLLAGAVIIAFGYTRGAASRLHKVAIKSQSTDELIGRLDKAMESINALGVSNKKQTAESINALGVSNKGQADDYAGNIGLEKLSLSGIVSTIDKPLAIVNGQVAAIGDKIEDFEVLDIKEKNIVVRDKNGEEKVINLYENE